MQAGKLRDQILIQHSISARMPSGQMLESWVGGKRVWAEITGITSRELLSSGAQTAEATLRVLVRFRRDITASSRLKVLTGSFKGETLQVVGAPIPDVCCSSLELLCKQGVVT